MEDIKLSDEVLVQIRARRAALSGLDVLKQMAQRELNIYLMDQLEAILGDGFDSGSRYNVDDNTGVISKIKEEVIKKTDASEKSGEHASEDGKRTDSPSASD